MARVKILDLSVERAASDEESAGVVGGGDFGRVGYTPGNRFGELGGGNWQGDSDFQLKPISGHKPVLRWDPTVTDFHPRYGETGPEGQRRFGVPQ